MVFMSGVTPRINLTDDGTSRAPLVPGTFDEQCVDAFSNLTLMLIKTGITKGDVVDVTVYLTNIATNTAAFRHRWDGFFSGVTTPPCRSIIGINALEGGYALQMRVVAMLPDQLI